MKHKQSRWEKLRSEAIPLIWLCAGSLVMTLLMTVGMFTLILAEGVTYYWPKPIVTVTLNNGTRLYGEIWETERDKKTDRITRFLLAHGSRDRYGVAYRWIPASDVKQKNRSPRTVRIERFEWGPVFGQPLRVIRENRVLLESVDVRSAPFRAFFEQSRHQLQQIRELENKIDAINDRLERLNRKEIRLKYRGIDLKTSPEARRIRKERVELQKTYEGLNAELVHLREIAGATRLVVDIGEKGTLELPFRSILRIIPANQMRTFDKIRLYFTRWWELITQNPREANTEGGIFPAIFGTVAMVLIMTLIVVPLGVVAAVYLREYARQNWWTRLIRIAVNNLAGVPSIVYGVFGVGFFIYFIGGWIDRRFFPEFLPTPTYGTGGILWASLTLALLTVPVVIVATEEALLAIPPEIRHGARALGATQWQTVTHIILPAALPGIMTGTILAIARATGEVAPLMLTGVVKMAPDLPIDGTPPYIHLERKFMHLGFHIYDVGFQSPDVEAAKPMVYNTTLLLLAIVILLNIVALILRNRVRKRYAGRGI